MDFIENVMKCILNTMSTDDLLRLLTHNKVWKTFVEEAGLSRDEAKELHDYLKKLTANRTTENKKKRLQEDTLARKKFLEMFPKVKADIESCTWRLRAIANKVHKVHKDCTVSSVVTSSVGAVSGVMNILGLSLAPFTAGGSLLLSAAGKGLGVVTCAVSVTTSIIEESNICSAEAKASHILSTSEDNVKKLLVAVDKIAPEFIRNCRKFIKNIKDMVENIHSLRRALANPLLVCDAIRFITTGGLSAQRAQLVQRALQGTALSMTRRARILGVVQGGFFLGMDVYYIVKDSKHLRNGARAPLAEELQQKAQELEKMLEELIQIHRTL
ncbi:PREDICTED: apolipoprotein L3-like [Chinchilla lanigera]|uniref:Apolipoprotein L3-like n=1 Tax=Chinchilla lanigera TaxID=34839 RepID=A0A8C2YUI8_CHILA|nr:PREDICTED: apolipoprotein L3-like [Chinchilla lanigera]